MDAANDPAGNSPRDAPAEPASAKPAAPVTDSPWFWAVLFLNAALIGLMLIGAKYRKREAMLERRYEIRRDSALRKAAGQPIVEQTGAEADPQAQDRPLLVPLEPLAAVLVAIDLVAIAFYRRSRRLVAADNVPLPRGPT